MLICLIDGRKTAPLSLSFFFFFRGGERPLRPPLDPPLIVITFPSSYRSWLLCLYIQLYVTKDPLLSDL